MWPLEFTFSLTNKCRLHLSSKSNGTRTALWICGIPVSVAVSQHLITAAQCNLACVAGGIVSTSKFLAEELRSCAENGKWDFWIFRFKSFRIKLSKMVDSRFIYKNYAKLNLWNNRTCFSKNVCHYSACQSVKYDLFLWSCVRFFECLRLFTMYMGKAVGSWFGPQMVSKIQDL